MVYQQRVVPKKRRKLKWRVIIPSFILTTLIVYIMYNLLFPKNLMIETPGFVICDYSQTKTQSVLNQLTYEEKIELNDYLFYGETLNIYNSKYDINTADYFIGKTIKLRDICNGNEWVYMLGKNVDEQIPIENLPQGFYEVFVVDNLKEKRLITSIELYDEFYTVRRNGLSKKVDIVSDIDLLRGKVDALPIMDDNYFFIRIQEQTLEEDNPEIYDVYIDAAHNTISYNYVEKGRTANDLIEADELYRIAVSVKDKLEAKGLKVLLSRESEDTVINQYGIDGRLFKAYQANVKHYIELNLNFTTNEDTRGSRIIYSSYSTNKFATSLFKSYLLTPGLVAYGRETSSNIAGVLSSSRYNNLDSYPVIREAGGRILSAGTISDLAIEQNSEFNKDERNGMQSVSLELFFISSSLDVSVYKNEFETLTTNLANGYLKYLGIE
jgi:N-acetylmuramoyl-L-alanine amidase